MAWAATTISVSKGFLRTVNVGEGHCSSTLRTFTNASGDCGATIHLLMGTRCFSFGRLLRTLGAAAFFLSFLTVTDAAAATPRKMAYQIMALNPQTGQVLADRDVDVRIELRRDKADGEAVWSQQFSVRTDAAGVCNLTLDLASDIDWAASTYYLASVVDGVDCGAPQVTSVPYALQAASLDGVITKEELVGTWRSGGSISQVVTYNSDGSGAVSYFYSDGASGGTDSFKWSLDTTGKLLWYDIQYEKPSSADDEVLTNFVYKISDTQIAYGDRLYQKQQ